MPVENRPIIAERFEYLGVRTARGVLAGAMLLGAFAAWHYARLGLTLSHYDARSHLVVARRVVDNLTPGWRQFGAVWLPLPHLLNLVPVQADWNFRTGFSGVAISIVAFSCGLWSLSRYLARHTGSLSLAILGPAIVLANPNVLYLQSTPLTEPLLFGLSLSALFAVDSWIGAPTTSNARRAGVILAALVLTRYEGWLIVGALVAIALVAASNHWRGLMVIAAIPATAIIVFLGLSFFSSGVLLMTSGFYTPDNPARGSLAVALDQVYADSRLLTGPVVMFAGAIGIVVSLLRAVTTRGRSLLPLSLFATALLPLAAFHAGHPERVRYMVTLAVALGATAGLAGGGLPRVARTVFGAVFLGAAIVTLPPFPQTTPMLAEAQWEVPFHDERARTVTRYLQEHYDGTPILANMGSLAHYMQETSTIGLGVRNFLHEGNGDLWVAAFASPRQYVRWILIEERALGGDQLARRAQQDTQFLSGFQQVSSGGGLVLYRRQP
jgi:hypothetical protein